MGEPRVLGRVWRRMWVGVVIGEGVEEDDDLGGRGEWGRFQE